MIDQRTIQWNLISLWCFSHEFSDEYGYPSRNCGLFLEKKCETKIFWILMIFFKFVNSPKHRVIVNITIHYCLDDDDIIKTFFFSIFFISFKKSRSQHQHNFLRYFLIIQFFFGLGSVENNQLLLGLHTWKPPQAYFRCIMASWA